MKTGIIISLIVIGFVFGIPFGQFTKYDQINKLKQELATNQEQKHSIFQHLLNEEGKSRKLEEDLKHHKEMELYWKGAVERLERKQSDLHSLSNTISQE